MHRALTMARRSLTWLGPVLFAVGLLLSMGVLVQSSRTSQKVTAQEITIVDASGHRRLLIGPLDDAGTFGFKLFDEQQQSRATIASGAQETSIRLTKSDGKALLTLGLRPDSTAYLDLQPASGQGAIRLLTTTGGEAFLVVGQSERMAYLYCDSAGGPAAGMGAGGEEKVRCRLTDEDQPFLAFMNADAWTAGLGVKSDIGGFLAVRNLARTEGRALSPLGIEDCSAPASAPAGADLAAPILKRIQEASQKR